MRDWRPGPVVTIVFIAELIGLWVTVSLQIFYDLVVDPVDLRINMTLFTTAAAWWTERMTR